MANPLPLPLPPPGQGTLLGPRHRSFQSYYGDTTLDPCQGRYDRIMSRFNVNENPGISHVMPFEQAVGAGILPQAYICCSATHQRATRIYCIHLPSKIFLALDGVPTQWDGQGFAFLGDVTQQVAMTVSFPTEFLQYVNMHYPVQPSWTLVTPPNDLLSNVNSAILNKLHTVALPLVEPTPPTRTGTCGSPSVSTFTATIPTRSHFVYTTLIFS